MGYAPIPFSAFLVISVIERGPSTDNPILILCSLQKMILSSVNRVPFVTTVYLGVIVLLAVVLISSTISIKALQFKSGSPP